MGGFFYRRWQSTADSKCDSVGDKDITYPSYAPASMVECVKNLTSTNAPSFFLLCADQVGSFVFRLRFPILTNKTPMIVAVGDAHVAREILLDHNSFKPNWIYKQDRGMNLFNSEGHRWKFARKGVAPAFSSRHIRRMNTVCLQKTEEWIQQKLEPSIDRGESFDLPSELTRLTIMIICEAAFEYNASESEIDQFTKDVEATLRGSQSSNLNIVKRSLGRLLASNRKTIAAADGVRNFSKKIIDAYREKQNPNGNSKKQEEEDATVVSLIVNNNKYKNDKERIADLSVFLIAGHDTTAYSLAWTLLELARNPSEMSRLKKMLSSMPREDWVRADVLKNALRESMRLHPVAALGSIRVPTKDVYYRDATKNKESTIITIPKGTTVFVPQILLNQNPAYYPNPDKFLPSRWEKNNYDDKSDAGNALDSALAAHMPFSLGRRNCVGQSLASAELHSVLARLVVDYDFTVEDEGRVEYFITLKPLGARLKAYHSK